MIDLLVARRGGARGRWQPAVAGVGVGVGVGVGGRPQLLAVVLTGVVRTSRFLVRTSRRKIGGEMPGEARTPGGTVIRNKPIMIFLHPNTEQSVLH